jgi:hypothetical protein
VKAAIIVLLAAATAHAEPVTLGLFAPTAPFPSTSARVELASRLGDALGKGASTTGTGKVYARAGDFAQAVRKGDINVALVDAAYLAHAGGNFTVIAAAVRGGDTNHGWHLVARGGKVADLKGKRLLVPGIGGREPDFVYNVLFGGEIARDFFAKLDVAPDTSSALAALGLGKAEAAIVPAGVELPSGMTSVLVLPAVSGPVLVVYGSVSADRRAALAAAAASFHGDATVGGFRVGDAEAVKAIARRFTVAAKRGPLAVPAVRLLVGELVEGRTFAIDRTSPATFAVAPLAKPAPASDGHH